jgi:outer membrane protein assembly factor BamB
MRRISFLAVIGLCLGLDAAGGEWPQYRGPNHDGISADRINLRWDGAVTNALWNTSTRNGFSSFAVSGGQAITQVKRTVTGFQKEVCVALSILDGHELWSTVIDDAVYDAGAGSDDGPRTTPSVDAGAVYVLSSKLKLMRLKAVDGTVVWKTNLLAGYGGTVIAWQNAASPLLDSGLIFVNVNCSRNSLLAIRASDGGLAWRSQESQAMTHSTPIIADVLGVRQVIFATQQGLVSLEPATGKSLWYFGYPFQYDMSLAASPVAYRDRVFISGSYGMGAVAAQVSLTNGAWSVRQLWSNDLASLWMTPICHDGYLYGHFGSSTFAAFKCVSLETGEEMWSIDGFGRGGTVLVNNHLVALNEDGTLVLAQPTPEAYVELGRFQAVAGKCWNTPALCDGRVYVRSTSQAACYDFSMPELKLECPRLSDANSLEMRVTTTDASPLDTNRLSSIAVLATTNLATPLAGWTKLTNALLYTNDSIRVGPLDRTAAPLQFYRVVETPTQP